MHRALPLLSLLVFGCAETRDPEAWDGWYGPMGALDEDVEEPIVFADEPGPYTDSQYSGGIGELQSMMTGFGYDVTRKFAPGEAKADGCATWITDNALPKEFWAMVTLHPRLYYKGVGCVPDAYPIRDGDGDELDIDSEEKYYGNFFVEDDSGGLFILNDSKVAHFRMGDRVKLRVRGIGERFDLESIVSHEILEIDRGPHPIAWSWAGTTECAGVPANFDPTDPADLAAFQAADIECEYDEPAQHGKVLRVEGRVLSNPDTFGSFHLIDDEGEIHQISLDSELNRRKVRFPVGSRIRVTAPVLNSFGNSLIIMKIGQTERLEG